MFTLNFVNKISTNEEENLTKELIKKYTKFQIRTKSILYHIIYIKLYHACQEVDCWKNKEDIKNRRKNSVIHTD